jgi:hypothetical protein
MMRSRKKSHRHSCDRFSVADAKRWWLRKGPGHAARVREAKGATWRQDGRNYVTLDRRPHKHDTLSDERRTTIMCDAGRLAAYSGNYRKGM